MKPQNLFSLFFSVAVLLMAMVSCDYVNPPYGNLDGAPEGCESDVIDPITPHKKVLLEDFTGHHCGWCPDGHREATELHDIYGEDLIISAIHVGVLASSTTWGPDFTYDFKCELGEDIDENLVGATLVGIPKGAIDRQEYGGDVALPWADWGEHVDEEIGKTPEVGLRIIPSFDVGTGQATVEVEIEYFETRVEGDYLMICVTEDEIIRPQKDYSINQDTTLLFYEHNHVLRGHFTTLVRGQQVCDQEIAAGSTFRRTFTAPLGADWVPENCNIVAYITDYSTTTIANAEEVDLVQ